MIEMIAGVFGLPVKKEGQKVRIVGMGPKDGPFSADPEQEARLVKLGLARYVSEEVAEDEELEDGEEGEEEVVDTVPIGFDDMPPEDFADDATVDESEEVAEDEAEDEPIDLSELSAKELREIGKEYGLSFKSNASKASMIEAIGEAQAAEALAAPSFDAAEAVL